MASIPCLGGIPEGVQGCRAELCRWGGHTPACAPPHARTQTKTRTTRQRTRALHAQTRTKKPRESDTPPGRTLVLVKAPSTGRGVGPRVGGHLQPLPQAALGVGSASGLSLANAVVLVPALHALRLRHRQPGPQTAGAHAGAAGQAAAGHGRPRGDHGRHRRVPAQVGGKGGEGVRGAGRGGPEGRRAERGAPAAGPRAEDRGQTGAARGGEEGGQGGRGSGCACRDGDARGPRPISGGWGGDPCPAQQASQWPTRHGNGANPGPAPLPAHSG